MFFGFASFYRQLIWGFSQIAASLISILKTTEPRNGEVGVGGDSKAWRCQSKIDRSGIDDVEVEVGIDEFGKKVRNLSKSKNSSKSKKIVRYSDFFTLRAKLAFTKLRQVFFKAPILHHFDLERYIRIETNASGYAIGRVLSQLTSNDSSRWYPVALISYKIILVETRYETHNGQLLAILEALKTWKHYLEGF